MSKIVKMKVGNVHAGMRFVLSKQKSAEICETHVDKINKHVEIVVKTPEGDFDHKHYDNLNYRIEVRP